MCVPILRAIYPQFAHLCHCRWLALSPDADTRATLTLVGSSVYAAVVFALSAAYAVYGYGVCGASSSCRCCDGFFSSIHAHESHDAHATPVLL
jgi:hypothetical protein